MHKTVIVFFIFVFIVNNLIAQPKQPNIIFILADDLGYGDLGCYGQQKIETPNLDKLAANGLKFTQFYSGSTVCAPARTSFMTGMHTGHTAIRGNKTFEPEGQTPLPDSILTFANMLQRQGYATAAFGKWSLGFITTSGDPNKKGFDDFFGYNCQSLAHDYYPDHLWNNHQRIDLSINEKYDSIYSASLIHTKVIEYIKRQSDVKPFFMYLPYTLPHGDVVGPHDDLYNYYVHKFNEQPLTGKKLKLVKGNFNSEPLPHPQFAAMIARLDNYVGDIVKTIAEKGLADNTLIIFTGDNGPHRENGGDPDFFNSTAGFRGIKRDLYEGGIREPFIAYWPSKIKKGVYNKPAALWDMYPTFLQLAGKKQINKNIDGISLVPFFLQKGKQLLHNYLYWEFHENNGRQAILWNNWKLIKLNVNTDSTIITELYNINIDPNEQDNVAEKYPALVKN